MSGHIERLLVHFLALLYTILAKYEMRAFFSYVKIFKFLWKFEKEIRLTTTRTDFGKLDLSLCSAACAKFYNPSEHLAVDEIVVLFIGRDIFK
jgi:hypothetical protein